MKAATLRDGARGGVRGAGREAGMSRAARAPPTAPPRHASDPRPLVPRPPLRRTCLCRVYTHMHVHALQDLLVPLRLWMDVDLGIAVGAAC